VTGGSGVVGKILCEELLSLGYKVENWDLAVNNDTKFTSRNYKKLIIDLSDKIKLLEVLNSVKKSRKKYFAIIFIHGIHELGESWNYKQSMLDEFMQVNFQANALIVSHLSKHVESKIINLSSISTLIPIPYSGIYGASKAALESWLISTSFELNILGIQVVNLVVGNINTGFNEKGVRSGSKKRSRELNKNLIGLASKINSKSGINPELVVKKIVKLLLFSNSINYYYGKNVRIYRLVEKLIGRNFAIILAHKFVTKGF
jgi:short-subunit dehydrogenase